MPTRTSIAVVALAALAALAGAVAPAAHADVSRFNCTIQQLRLPFGGKEWPPGGGPVDFRELTLSGSASCTRPNAANQTVTLSASGAILDLFPCTTPNTGNATLSGTLQLTTANGLRDRRPFTISYSPDSGAETQPGTMTVDGGPATSVDWHFGFRRCIGQSKEVEAIDFSGSFQVPLARNNPKLLTRVEPIPGHPDPIAVDPATSTIYVGSFTSAAAVLTGAPVTEPIPSKVWAYDYAGNLKASWTIQGQNLTQPHGITGIAVNSVGQLYLTDINPPRVVVLDPRTGIQSTFGQPLRDLRPCSLGGAPGDCSQEPPQFGDRPPLPNGIAPTTSGLYVTDTTQGVIWRYPPSPGARPEVWLSDSRFKSFIGLNGIRYLPAQDAFYFVFSNSQPPGTTDQLQGALYKVTRVSKALTRVWTGGTNEGPDSFAPTQNGNLFVALAGDGLRTGFVVVSPSGQVLQRRSAPDDRISTELPYDTVADVAFIGTRAIFTNSSNFGNNPANYALFEYDAGDPGLALERPLPYVSP